MTQKTAYIFSFLVCCIFIACENEQVPNLDLPLYELVSSNDSGVNFSNEVYEEDAYNHVLMDAFYDGAGLAVLDVNNDGLPDLYFAANQGNDRLYLNKGNMEFEDISKSSGIFQQKGNWSSCVTIADVNKDGFDDIYVGKFLDNDIEKRKNTLFINQKDNTFLDQAESFKVADSGYTTSACFFDYDNDGWLDLYVGNQPHIDVKVKKNREFDLKNPLKYSDKLYRNNQGKGFTDVTVSSNILNFTYTLSSVAGDYDNDGDMDLFVTSDYEEPDMFYRNLGNGTFKEVAKESFRHTSNFSMGSDMGDINNDGYLDLMTNDMAFENNFRQKANMSGMNPEKFQALVDAGYNYQYMFNCLQINNANYTFSEIAQMAGVFKTDWSWTVLFMDADHDGNKDIFITNGQPKDLQNKDYHKKRAEAIKEVSANFTRPDEKVNAKSLSDLAPTYVSSNYMFRNNGDFTFTNVSEDWGLGQPAWSIGAVYADLDKDGDLEIIINNINEKAFIYKSNAVEKKENNFLQIHLKNKHKNGNGARIYVHHDGQRQLIEIAPNRGYMSTVQAIAQFGLGESKKVDKVEVQFELGKTLVKDNVAVNSTLVFDEKDANNQGLGIPTPTTLFRQMPDAEVATFNHIENEYDDYKDEVLLPYRMSRLGPTVCEGDVNNDGLADLFFGSAANQVSVLYIQNKSGGFTLTKQSLFNADRKHEDLDALFFDADGDQDLDLYVCSGGNEFKHGDQLLQDRLYLNDGKGQFTSKANLPTFKVSTASVSASDFDKDGDMDLFVGGRNIPNKYGYSAPSILLSNENGIFTKAVDKIGMELLENLGMITAVQWLDVDGDQDDDLLVAGEFMELRLFINTDGSFEEQTEKYGLQNTEGMWNVLHATDIDDDGDMDIVAGNMGMNNKVEISAEKPFEVFVKDFDDNGTNDVYLGYHEDGKCYPVRGRQCSSEQMPFIKEKYENYTAFASATLDQVLENKLEQSIHKKAIIPQSSLFVNQGDNFKRVSLPNWSQISPIYGISSGDYNNDGKIDLFMVGNFYEREVETTRSDAGNGVILINKGKQNFEALMPYHTGIKAIYDARDVCSFKAPDGKDVLVVANNNGASQFYKLK